MATSVVDALVVTFGLDASNYQKGRKEVSEGLKNTREDANKTAKEMEAQGKRAASFFSSIKNELLALAGVTLSVAGLSSFVRNTTIGLQQLAVQSQALGLSARQLDGWSKAAQAAGSSAEKITGTLGNFQNAIQAYRNGDASSPIFKALAMLNGDTGVTFDPMKQDSDSLMRTAAQAIQQERSGDRARYLARMLGIDDATFQAMRSGRFIPDVDKYGRQSGITDADVRNAQKFNREWTDLQQRLEKTGYLIYGTLSPYVEQFTRYLTRLADWMAQHPEEIEAAIKSFFGTVSEIARTCDDAAKAVGGWKNAILLLIGASVGGKFLGFLSTFSRGLLGITRIPVVGWLAGIAAYAKYLHDDRENIAASARSSLDYTKGNIGDILRDLGIDTDFGKNPHTVQGTPDVALDIPGVSSANDKQLDALKKGQDEARRDERRSSDDSKGQRNKTNDILGRILDFLVPSAAADTLEPNLAGADAVKPPQATGSGRKLLDGLTDLFSDTETKYGLPPGLLRSVATVESSGNPNAVSPAGARGLFQFMPGTARGMGLHGNDVFDPQKSTEAAGKYLSQLLKQTGGDLHSALAAYNWGIGNVQKKGLSQAPEETRKYVPKVLSGIQPGAGMNVDRSPPARETAQTGPQYHIGSVTVQSSASRVDQLTADIGRSAQNRARVLGFDTRKTS
ncbi:hypothetical protein ABW11_21020 [Pluralibacter gergoviae]|uniref:lytic transglycosylase domain-containing protein n=1 Tax=Pluralibacter gergoviae TaxID=61647 RepID=UPI00065189CC|nr:lytic transglycosylase domain-containing protein [Pluralibacter gergoviae]KMK23095.1 hypothetical protein ABW11_21020 [Pluralibacter gergoviae]